MELLEDIENYSRRMYVKKWLLVNKHTSNPDDYIRSYEDMFEEALSHPDFMKSNTEFKNLHNDVICKKIDVLGAITMRTKDKRTLNRLDIMKNYLYLCLDL